MSGRMDRGDDRWLGYCPDCGTAITPGYLLIEYESAESGQKRYAECPACRTVDHPR